MFVSTLDTTKLPTSHWKAEAKTTFHIISFFLFYFTDKMEIYFHAQFTEESTLFPQQTLQAAWWRLMEAKEATFQKLEEQ